MLTVTEAITALIEALQIEASDTMSKPFNPVELSLRIESTVGLIEIEIQQVATLLYRRKF